MIVTALLTGRSAIKIKWNGGKVTGVWTPLTICCHWQGQDVAGKVNTFYTHSTQVAKCSERNYLVLLAV